MRAACFSLYCSASLTHNLTPAAPPKKTKIPRTIQAPFMVAGGRVEVLVRCSGNVGATYVMSASSASPYNDNNFGNDPMLITQKTLATIKLVRGAKNAVLSQPLVDEACTPRRAGYAADLRDANLLANNYSLSSIFAESVAFSGTNLTSSCGVRYNDGPNMIFTPDAEPILMPLGKVCCCCWLAGGDKKQPLSV